MLVWDTQQWVSESLIHYGEYSEGESELFRSLIRPGDVVVEVGANIGALTLPLSQIVGRAGSVYAFEPQRLVFQMLCANLALNDIRNVECAQVAVGMEPGATTIEHVDYDQPNNNGGARIGEPGESVGVVTLDSYNFDRLDFLKADVEGSECEVLVGAARTIMRLRPILYVENDREDRTGELLAIIDHLGYRAFKHYTPLYSPDNFHGNPVDRFSQDGVPVASWNLLCIHKASDVAVEGLPEITL